MRPKFLYVLLLTVLPAFAAGASICAFQRDSLAAASEAHAVPDSLSLKDRDWWHNLKKGYFNTRDTTIIYPRFLQFCVDVYNWGDTAFNSYDPDYVEGTGKKWKAMLKSDNWSDSYAMNIGHRMPMWMLSEVYCNAGFYLSFMAVSVGYSIDLSNIIGNRPALHKKLDFNFTCVRFNADFYYAENTGGSVIRRFGDYNDGRVCREQFPGVSFRSLGVDVYYFFNHSRYSQGAVYNFSKYQKRSSGSFILGFSYSDHDIDMDFSRLPDYMRPFYKLDEKQFDFKFSDYSLIAGYGHNFVAGKRVTFNITLLPSFGIKHAHRQCIGGRATLLSMNYKGKVGMVYNIEDFFAGIYGKIDGHWFLNSKYSFFNSVINFGLNAGVRF